jgi:hypothetical protein
MFTKKRILIIVGIVAVLVVAFVVYNYMRKKKFVSTINRLMGWLKAAKQKMDTINSTSSSETQKESAKKWLAENGGEDWVKNIEAKAADKNISFEAQLPIDVRYAVCTQMGIAETKGKKWYPAAADSI